MTHEEIANIARRMNKEVQKKIDEQVAERLDILRQGDLSEADMERAEDCLYMSLVLQEFLDGEYELLEEERVLLLDDMEELYNEYSDLLVKAKLEEKVGKKKRMALELMRIREQLFKHKDRMKFVNEQIKGNRDNKGKLDEVSNKKAMKEMVNPDKQKKFGIDNDMGVAKDKGGLSVGKFASIDKRLSDLERFEDKTRRDANREKKENKITLAENALNDSPGARDPLENLIQTTDRVVENTMAQNSTIDKPGRALADDLERMENMKR